MNEIMDSAIKILRNPNETEDAKDLAEVVLRQCIMPPMYYMGPSGELGVLPTKPGEVIQVANES